VSLFYEKVNIVETIKIVLWAGLDSSTSPHCHLGRNFRFLCWEKKDRKSPVEEQFANQIQSSIELVKFPNDGIDTALKNMAQTGVFIMPIDVQENWAAE